jgi:hypothetical protein
MRLPEPAPQEQRAKSVIDIFTIFFSLFWFSNENRIFKNGSKSHYDFHTRLMNIPRVFFKERLCGVIRDPFSFLGIFTSKGLNVALVANPVNKTQLTQFLAHPQNIRFVSPVLCIYVDYLAVVA